jgi:hypothetical protein
MARVLPALLVGTLGLGLLVVSGRAEEKADANHIARLVAQLGSNSFDQREEATRLLDTIGPAALPALHKAENSDDAEVRRRARLLVRTLEKRQDTERILAPQRIRLDYKDELLPHAVADFARKTGFDLRLDPEGANYAERSITLNTGEVTFWEAFDRFCREAGLVERVIVPTPERSNNPRGGNVVINQVIIVNGRVVNPQPDSHEPEVREGRLILRNGKTHTLPTHYAGPLRIRALPTITQLTEEKKVEGQILLGLEVTAEPKMRWLKLVGVRINKAVDDEGQALSQVMPLPRAAPANTGRTTGGVVIVNGQVISPEDNTPHGDPRQVPVRLKQGEKPAKSLRELSGSIAALVQTAPRSLITVDKVLQSVGQSATGPEGSSLRVVDINREEKGEIKVRLAVESPPRDISDGTNSHWTGGGVLIVNGRVIGGADPEPHGTSFALLDEKGREFKLLKSENDQARAGSPREYRLTFAVEQGQGDPARLVYTGPLSAVIDVPFTLKDVPLP